jgi:hypothetical protein
MKLHAPSVRSAQRGLAIGDVKPQSHQSLGRRSVQSAAPNTLDVSFGTSPGRAGTASSDVAEGSLAGSQEPSSVRSAEQSSWATGTPSVRQQVLEETAGWLRAELPSIFSTGVRFQSVAGCLLSKQTRQCLVTHRRACTATTVCEQ